LKPQPRREKLRQQLGKSHAPRERWQDGRAIIVDYPLRREVDAKRS
jgi:hypothetical protein